MNEFVIFIKDNNKIKSIISIISVLFARTICIQQSNAFIGAEIDDSGANLQNESENCIKKCACYT